MERTVRPKKCTEEFREEVAWTEAVRVWLTGEVMPGQRRRTWWPGKKPNPWEGNVGSDNRVIEGTEREMESQFADVCFFGQVLWEMKKKKDLKASVYNQNYRFWFYTGITHMTGKSPLNIQAVQEQWARENKESIQKHGLNCWKTA